MDGVPAADEPDASARDVGKPREGLDGAISREGLGFMGFIWGKSENPVLL